MTALPNIREPDMSTNHLLTISLLLPLVAISATAQAGSTITDKSYWPSEARRSAPIETGSRTDVNSAFAYDRAESPLQYAINANAGGSAWRYQGGPKGRWRVRQGLRISKDLHNPLTSGFTTTRKDIPMTLNPYDALVNANSLSTTLGSYFVRYRMALYLALAAATSLSVAWNWNWLTGAEVFRIMASLPCTFMMLMCMNRAACRSS
jgi:hypothetical protein